MFKKGQSGNPKGRPKALDVDLFETLSLLIELLLKVKVKDKIAREKLHKIIEIISSSEPLHMLENLVKMLTEENKMPITQIAKQFNVTRQTIHNYIR